MNLLNVIIGAVVTEKAERLKAMPRHTYTLRVAPKATKVEVQTALEKYYGVEVASVRMSRIQPKTRVLGPGKSMEKRHAAKKALVTLGKKSKALDLAAFSHS
jgi:ribosomal protein L23